MPLIWWYSREAACPLGRFPKVGDLSLKQKNKEPLPSLSLFLSLFHLSYTEAETLLRLAHKAMQRAARGLVLEQCAA